MHRRTDNRKTYRHWPYLQDWWRHNNVLNAKPKATNRTASICVWIIVHSCHRQYNTKQFCLSPSFAVQSSTAHMPLLTQPARADSDCWNIDYFQQMRWGSKLYKHTHKHTVTRQNASISLNNCLTQAKDIQLECLGRLKAYNNVLSWLQQQNDALIYGWSQVGWHFNTDPASNQPNNPPANYPVTVNKK